MIKPIYILVMFFILLSACEKNDFELTKNANEFFFLRNDGADLPVWVKGNTLSKTFIIYLHGGPTSNGSFDWIIQESEFINSLTTDYALVFYDQRGTSSSQGNYDKSSMTQEKFVDDLDKLITLVNAKYGSDIGIFLYGFSWGGYLGSAYITSYDYQYKIKGWINDSGNHDILQAANYGKKMLIHYAQQQLALDKNKNDWNEILDWCEQNDTILEINDFVQYKEYQYKANKLMSASTVSTINWNSKANRQMLFNSPHSASSTLSNNLFNHYIAENYKTLGLSDKLFKIRIPVLLARGKYDFGVPEQSHGYAFNEINSVVKHKITFENSGHGVCFGETKLFLAIMKDFIEKNK